MKKFIFDITSFVIGMLYTCILNASVFPIREKWRKECNYNCKKCKVFDCPKHRCDNLRRKNNGSDN